MKRIAVLISLAALASIALFLNAGKDTEVTLINARAIPLDGQTGNFVVTFEVQNHGSPKTLASIQPASARGAHVMNPGYHDTPIVIPARSSGIFAMDGAHVMLMGVETGLENGGFIPLTLTFEDYGDVTLRALNVGGSSGMGAMDHSVSYGIQSIQSPSIAMTALNGIDRQGGDIDVDIKDLSLVRVADDAPHVPKEGHAHIYLNGLKLGRLYETRFTLGALPSGSYELKTTLNTNSHQPYVKDGAPIQDVLQFQVD